LGGRRQLDVLVLYVVGADGELLDEALVVLVDASLEHPQLSMQMALEVRSRGEFRMVEEGLDDLVLECEELESRDWLHQHTQPRKGTPRSLPTYLLVGGAYLLLIFGGVVICRDDVEDDRPSGVLL
jgi:hypothetical protein